MLSHPKIRAVGKPIAARDVVTRGGITIHRDTLGNLLISARGNGQCHVQNADVPDLQLCLADLEAMHPRSKPDGE